METTIINSPRAPIAVGSYPHARKVGNFLFLSGVGPRIRGKNSIPGVIINEKNKIISYDFDIQCRNVIKNVKFIVEDAGFAFSDIIDVTAFLIDIENDFKKYNEIYAEHFKDIQPCRTTVEVNKLPTPIAIELKIIAYLSK